MRPDVHEADTRLTLEHCSVLYEYLKTAVKSLGPNLEDLDAIVDAVDIPEMHDRLLTMLREEQLMKLYQTEFGKGYLVGAYFTSYILPELLIDEDGDEYPEYL